MSELLTSANVSSARGNWGGKIRDSFPVCQGNSVPLQDGFPGDDNPLMETDDALHRRIRGRMDELGLTEEKASLRAGLDKTYMRKFFERPGSAPRHDTLAKIARALEMPVSALLDLPPAEEPPPAFDARPAPVDMPQPAHLPNDVPVKGTAAGSHLRGAFQLEVDTIVDWVRRPPALSGARHAYALFVEGSSMEPRYLPGDLVFVHPDRPPRPGDTVVVQAQAGPHAPLEATIGYLRRRTERAVIIAKINPAAEVELKAETVKAIHKVLSTNELFGV